jgi:hypothetical protein
MKPECHIQPLTPGRESASLAYTVQPPWRASDSTPYKDRELEQERRLKGPRLGRMQRGRALCVGSELGGAQELLHGGQFFVGEG